jgi:hypothetical protein
VATAGAPPEPEAAASPAGAGELEALAAEASLKDLQQLIPPAAAGPLSDADVDRIARRVAEILGDRGVQDVVWEVVPELAEAIIREHGS